ncbi:sulfite exporter TauE/SafE family protein [Caldimonas caldifontis]|uniref:Sulfite exporter TauE/SafE family protein n=1 Tax=Caldimonas caldifontis TaxID=1452508 RepID=A0A2S5STB4_9BURK|nr:sulfite exporter TauE/SafE family protein [Caldimonas caldifontis]PPE65953.1 sulfite exporter TauE/SafE family protein [Caldimonas caldifontis]
MITAVLLSAALMGLAGSVHCMAMCGAATLAIGRDGPSLWAFQAGRLAGYATAGALAAGAVQALQWGAQQVTVLQPFWAMVHVAVIVLGLALVWLGRQPRWLDALAHQVWQRLRHASLGWPQVPGRFAAAGAGLLWTFLPCGLLYSALMVAALGSTPWDGALAMAVFAASSAVGLQVMPWVWRRLKGQGAAVRGAWAVRAAGAVLAATSGWALWHGLWAQFGAPVCR